MPQPRNTTLRLSLLLLGLTLLAYAPVLRGGFIWDDDDYVTNNPNLRSIEGLREIWLTPRASPQYYPMVFTTFWVEHQLWGTRATGYHVVNALLHAGAAILLWRVLVLLDIPAAFLAACLFAVHPVHAESVAWISERKNVLSAVFYFASALAYLRSGFGFRISGFGEDKSTTASSDVLSYASPEPRHPKPDTRYVLALLLFVAALLSKTVTCSLPAALLLVRWWKRGKLTRHDVLPLVPFFVIGLALALNTARLEVDHVRAIGPEWDLSFVERTLIASRAIWFYATKLVLPLDLSFIYPKWSIDPRQPWQWAFVAATAVALLVLWRMRGRWGRGPVVAALIFCGTLVPALGFFNVYPMRYAYVADHFQYHASAALLVLIAAGLQRVAGRGAYAGAALLVLMTMSRAAVFSGAERLWRDTLAKNPDSWMVNLNLAKLLATSERIDEATPYFERQVQLAPHLPDTHWNLAGSLAQRGLFDEAIATYSRAIEMGGDPLPQALLGRGRTYLKQWQLAQAQGQRAEADRKLADATADFLRATEAKPDYALAYNELGTALKAAGQFEAALRQYARAAAIDPQYAEARVNLAALLARAGRMNEARAEFDAAVRINPSLRQYESQVLRGP